MGANVGSESSHVPNSCPDSIEPVLVGSWFQMLFPPGPPKMASPWLLAPEEAPEEVPPAPLPAPPAVSESLLLVAALLFSRDRTTPELTTPEAAATAPTTIATLVPIPIAVAPVAAATVPMVLAPATTELAAAWLAATAIWFDTATYLCDVKTRRSTCYWDRTWQ
jgi:hypothetical protein